MEIKQLPIHENESYLTELLENNSKNQYEQIPPYTAEHISLAAFDDGHYLGGIVGTIVWNHLHIKMLAVTSELKQTGIGTALMIAAEEVAIKAHCNLMIVDTMNWQAPDFYQKMGFRIFGQVKGIPIETSSKIYLVKYLNN